MRRFELHRTKDISGVSGTGLICEGVLFTDGTAVLRWVTDLRSTAVYECEGDVLRIHGHDGNTEIKWLDEIPLDVPPELREELSKLEDVTERLAASVKKDDARVVLNASAYLMIICARSEGVSRRDLVAKVRAMYREAAA